MEFKKAFILRQPRPWRTPLLLAAMLALTLHSGCSIGDEERSSREIPVPVEVAPVETGPIVLTRNLSGTLRSSADFVVASKVSSRVRELMVRVADSVNRGEVVAVLDDEPFVQEVKRAEAEFLVAKANLAEARANQEIAGRGMDRLRQLSEQGFASDTELDTALTNQLAAEAAVRVAEAQIASEEAAVESARIQLGYTQVRADWTEGEGERVVAERFLEEGDTVSVNQPIFRILDLDPLLAVVFVTETDYSRIHVGDPITVRTDAFPDQVFEGKVIRIAPLFSELSRQASVEFHVPNPGKILKPGMFVRASLVLERKSEAQIVPEMAIVRRNEKDGIFLVDPDRKHVTWQPVTMGIREGNRVEILSPGINGEVVFLGQQLLEDGSPILIGDDVEVTQ